MNFIELLEIISDITVKTRYSIVFYITVLQCLYMCNIEINDPRLSGKCSIYKAVLKIIKVDSKVRFFIEVFLQL